MSVYIKDMEMPINPDMAPTAVWVYPNGYAVVFKDNGKMQQYTQAAPVPPHGDLIDKQYAYQNTMAMGEHMRKIILKQIDLLPTIIPAERGGRDMSTWIAGKGTISAITTNADKFRSMSDEELAEYFPTHASLCPDLEENKMVCKGANFMADDKMCRQCWLKWLKQDAQMDIY